MDYGKLTDEDKVYIGNPYPALQLGLNMNFEYKGFDLAANFFGTFGNKIFNLQKARYSGAGGQNVFKGTLNKAWHGEGTSDDTAPELQRPEPELHPRQRLLRGGRRLFPLQAPYLRLYAARIRHEAI